MISFPVLTDLILHIILIFTNNTWEEAIKEVEIGAVNSNPESPLYIECYWILSNKYEVNIFIS